MSTTALARPRSPEEAMREKVGLLMEALKTLRGRDYQFDPQIINKIILHVIGARGLNQTSPRDTSLATAIVMVSLNFALDFVTEKRITEGRSEDKLTIAVSLLERNQLIKLYLVAERHFAELDLAGRAEKLLKQSVVTIQGDGSRRLYDLLDRETYEVLVRLAKGELSDYPNLPPATKTEEDVIVKKLDEIAADLKLARKVNWHAVLGKANFSRFSAELFQRTEPGTPSVAGNVWSVFLLSLVVKAMSERWTKQVMDTGSSVVSWAEAYVYLDAPTVAKFIANLLLDWEGLERKSIQAAANIAKLVFDPKNGVFVGAYSKTEVQTILDRALELLNIFGRDALQHYLPEDVEKPTDDEVDEFARTRLFVFIDGNQDRRTARAQAAIGTLWTTVDEARNLDDLVNRLAGFTAWPSDEQNRLVDRFDLENLLPANQSQGDETSAYALDLVLSRISEARDGKELTNRLLVRINWDDHVDLIINVSNYWPLGLRENPKRLDWLKTIFSQVQWSVRTINRLAETHGFSEHGNVAVKTIASELTPDQWKNLVNKVRSRDSWGRLFEVWLAMSTEQKAQAITDQIFTGLETGRLFEKGSVAEMRSVLEIVLTEVSSSPEKWAEFERWRKQINHSLVFEEKEKISGGFVDTFIDLYVQYRPR